MQEISHEDFIVGVTNSVAKLYSDLRGSSKPITFALTYAGTWITLVEQCGLPKHNAHIIEDRFKRLYNHSIRFIEAEVERASKDGFITGAFGLKLRTPVLKQTILNTRSTPYAAAKEARTAGNMRIQSYGMLNSETLNKVLKQCIVEFKAHEVLPVASIHDSNYFYILNDLGLLERFNKLYISKLKDYTLPELQHPTIKLGGELELYYPTWADVIPIANNASTDDIVLAVQTKLSS